METQIDTAELRKDLTPIVAQARSLVVSNPEDAQIAFNLRGSCKAFEKKVKEFFAPHKKRADDVHAELCASEKKELAPASEAIGIIDSKLSAFQEAQRKAQEIAQREAEAKARKEADDKAEAAALAAEQAGEHEEAAAIIAEPVQVAAVKPVVTPKLAGGSFRTSYFGTVTDKAAFLRAVANNPGWYGLVEIPQGSLNSFAAATKGVMQIPGLSFGSKQIPVGR